MMVLKLYWIIWCFLWSWSLCSSIQDVCDLSLRSQQDVPYLNSKLGRYYSEIDFVDAYTQDGYILLFPPHVNHTVYVGELNKEDMRLTFSFNIMCNDSLNRYQIMEKKKEIENLKIVNSKAIGFKNK